MDASGTAGVRGAFNDWTYDVSGQYGHNSFAFTIGDTLNVSLGPSLPPNKTEFDAGTLELNQFVGNVDVSRRVPRRRPFAGPLNVAFGAEFRRENYQIIAGEPDSYGDGGVPNQCRRSGGDRRAGVPRLPPVERGRRVAQQRGRLRRRRGGRAPLAAARRRGTRGALQRFREHGGRQADGARAADRRFVVRGSVSTGFRAPSLGQSFFSSTATNFLNLGQGLVPVESLTLPVELRGGAGARRAAARAGATRCIRARAW